MTTPSPQTGQPPGFTGITAYVGLGANLGEALAEVASAAQALGQLPMTHLLAASGAYRSAPVDASGPDFINAVVALQTRLSALQLLDHLQALELQHGRQRPYRNAPRTLDLDLLLYGEERIDHPRLQVPHPRMHLRAFVREPLNELAPGLLARWGFDKAPPELLHGQRVLFLGPIAPP